jgi:hypothetical protein
MAAISEAFAFVTSSVLHVSHVGTYSTQQLVDAVHAASFELYGRPSKTVSDALRWEVRRARVLRRGRGLYEAGWIAPATKSRMRTRVAQLRARSEIVAGMWNYEDYATPASVVTSGIFRRHEPVHDL